MADWVWPNGKKTPPPVNSPYGWRIHPVTKQRRKHYGTDFHIPQGINRSVTDGTVTHVGVVAGWADGGYGVWVKNTDGSLAKYFHGVTGSAYVKVGQKVKAGDALSKTGETGKASGVHLHLEISPGGGAGGQVDPVEYLKKRVAQATGGGGAVEPPVPATPDEEEDDDMPKNSGVVYERKNSDGTKSTVYLIFNAGSGWYHEFSAGPNKGGMGGEYVNPFAKALDTPSWATVTESHARVIKAGLDKINKT